MKGLVPTAFWTVVLATQSLADTPAASSPVGIGKPHVCGQEYYPLSAVRSFSSGTTIVEFTIDTDGAPQDVKVASSSGNTDLDAAAVACASTWRYSPARQDGKPVSVLWKAQIVWKMPTIYVPVSFNPDAHRCAVMFERKPSGPPEETELAFFIDENGHVNDVRVAKSSGDTSLDSTLMKCVGAWTYVPPTQDGKPVGVTWGVTFEWSEAGPLSIGEGLLRAHYCVTRFQRRAPSEKTLLKYRISQYGAVAEVEIAQSSGDAEFDNAARECAETWHYRHLDNPPPSQSIDWSAQVSWSYWLGTVAELGRGDAIPDGQR